MPDVDFYFDPVCPFAWITSKWVRQVARLRGIEVGWRLISLRLLNADKDYETDFPPGYEAGHTLGLRLLRVAAAARAAHGEGAAADLQHRFGAAIFDSGRGAQRGAEADTRAFVVAHLVAAGLPATLADALDDPGLDTVIQAETDDALRLAGRDVGTPILHFSPPDGPAFFGPVISRLPGDDDAVRLWDHVEGLAGFAGFAELKRSLREIPQLAAYGSGEADSDR